MSKEIINKVSSSGLINIDLSNYAPKQKIHFIDLKNFLFEEMILKERHFRNLIKDHDWEPYKNEVVAVDCSANTIVPMWAYMLIASNLELVNAKVFSGDQNTVFEKLFLSNIYDLDVAEFKNKRVLINGCSDIVIPQSIYIVAIQKLQKVTKSIMFGEACSSVPIFKQK